MRRTSIFMLACLALPLLAATKPARHSGREEVYFTITLTEATSHASGKLRARSVQWGSTARAGTNELAMEDTAGGADASKEVQRKDLTAQDKMGDFSRGSHPVGGNETITVGSSRTEGQATGKRVHKPFRARMYYDQAQPEGSLTVQGSFPGCQVGKRYGGMQFAAGGTTYQLQDVTIADCPASAAPTETITFVYGKIETR